MPSMHFHGPAVRRKPNHYERLRVMPTATQDELRRAYRTAAMRWHPDRARKVAQEAGPAVAERWRRDAVESMALINAAYDVLRDPERRREYDASLFHVQMPGAMAEREVPLGARERMRGLRRARQVTQKGASRTRQALAPHWVGLGLALCSLLLFSSGWALYRALNDGVEFESAMHGGLPTLGATPGVRHMLDGEPLPLSPDAHLPERMLRR